MSVIPSEGCNISTFNYSPSVLGRVPRDLLRRRHNRLVSTRIVARLIQCINSLHRPAHRQHHGTFFRGHSVHHGWLHGVAVLFLRPSVHQSSRWMTNFSARPLRCHLHRRQTCDVIRDLFRIPFVAVLPVNAAALRRPGESRSERDLVHTLVLVTKFLHLYPSLLCHCGASAVKATCGTSSNYLFDAQPHEGATLSGERSRVLSILRSFFSSSRGRRDHVTWKVESEKCERPTKQTNERTASFSADRFRFAIASRSGETMKSGVDRGQKAICC